MKTCRKLEWLVAVKVGNDPIPWYHEKGRYWQRNPRHASFLTADTADRVLERYSSRFPDHAFAIVSIPDAIRLFALQQRRGDTRSLVGPDGPGSLSLTARSSTK